MNLGFEDKNSVNGLPLDWYITNPAYNHNILLDSNTAFEGKYSLKLELQTESTDEECFILHSIPSKYLQDTIEISGYFKSDLAANAKAGIVIFYYKNNQYISSEILLDSMAGPGNDWHRSFFKPSIPAQADLISCGPVLSGRGTLWTDNFEISANDKVLVKKQMAYIPLDKAYLRGSGIDSLALTAKTYQNLFLLAKIWGFIKYYHPLIAEGKYNWDNELLKFLPEYLQIQDNAIRNQALFSWINSLGALTDERSKNWQYEECKVKPSIDWIYSGELGDSLVTLLHNISNSPKKSTHYYLKHTLSGNFKFSNEEAYSTQTPDVGIRLIALFRFWNIIEYFFPYKYLIEENWDDVLMEYLPKFIAPQSSIEYKLLSLELISKTNDRHAYYTTNDPDIFSYWGENYPPYNLEFLENHVIVSGFYKEYLPELSPLSIGDTVLEINEISINSIIKQRSLYIPASNYHLKSKDIVKWDLLRTKADSINISYLNNGKLSHYKVATFNLKEMGYFSKFYYTDTCYREFPGDVAYLYTPTLDSKKLQKVVPKLQTKAAIIIDFRGYPKCNLLTAIGDLVMSDSVPFARITYPSLSRPGLFTFKEEPQYFGNKEKSSFSGKLIVLVNEQTISTAEYQTMAFQQYPNCTVIGSQTAGADGNISNFVLPTNIVGRITATGIYYPDYSETQRVGIEPDVWIEPSINGLLENKDEVLDKALELARK